MSSRAFGATAWRILQQLGRDPGTVAMLMVVPALLVVLVRYVFDNNPSTFQRVGAPLVGVFPLLSMFLITSIAMLRERTSGTLERLMTMPIAKIDLLIGYSLAFAVIAITQALFVSFVAIALMDLDVQGPIWLLVLLSVVNSILGMTLGLLLGAFARTEFQAVQFMPAFVLPQFLMCGLLTPRESMSEVIQWLSNFLPMTYGYDALYRVTTETTVSAATWRDLALIAGIALVALPLDAATLRRRTS